MAQSVRIEFLKLGVGGASSPENIIRGNPPSAAQTLAVSNTATVAGIRPAVPINAEYGQAVRLVAIGNPVYVTWGDNPTASLINSVRLSTEIPEMIYVPDGQLLSFIAEAA